MRGEKLIVNACVTGMIPTKADNASVPITPREIAEDVERCVAAGASIVHLHARDDVVGRAGRRCDAPCVRGTCGRSTTPAVAPASCGEGANRPNGS